MTKLVENHSKIGYKRSMHLYQLLFSLLTRQMPDQKKIIFFQSLVLSSLTTRKWQQQDHEAADSLHLQSKSKDRWVLGSAHFFLFLYIHALGKVSCAAISKTGPTQWRRDLHKSLWGAGEKDTPIFRIFSTLIGICPRISCDIQILFHCSLTCIHHTPDPSKESSGKSLMKLTTREYSCWQL